MDLTKLTDQEKSVMLARAMGGGENTFKWWTIEFAKEGDIYTHAIPADLVVNFYDPANMALAWRVLNWAASQREYRQEWSGWMIDCIDANELVEKPAVAQRAWLDHILEMAIEAGIVELTHELD